MTYAITYHHEGKRCTFYTDAGSFDQAEVKAALWGIYGEAEEVVEVLTGNK